MRTFCFLVPPGLTLWVGLASGHLVAYGVNLTKKGSSNKIDLLPTSKHCDNGSVPSKMPPHIQLYDCHNYTYVPFSLAEIIRSTGYHIVSVWHVANLVSIHRCH